MARESECSSRIVDLWNATGAPKQQPVAVVLADEVPVRPDKLTGRRCAAALPFAGKYRLIDFALSNCVNSEIESVGVIAQHQPRSLYEHLSFGRPWDLDRDRGGLTLLCPYQAREGMNWYTGTADAIYQNRDFLDRADEVLLLDGRAVYSMDFCVLISQHRKTGAGLTIGVSTAGIGGTGRQVTLQVDLEGRVRGLGRGNAETAGQLVAMGVFLFSKDLLIRRLEADAEDPDSSHDLVHDVVSHMIEDGDVVFACAYSGYWRGLAGVDDYWLASMDLLSERPGLNLQDSAWPIRTRPEMRPPARISTGARLSHSLVCEGCLVDGTVEYSILSPGVCVSPGAVVRNSVLMHDVSVEERAVVENAVLDMDVIVGPCAHVGQASRHAPTLDEGQTPNVTVVCKGARIPGQADVSPEQEPEDWLVSARRQGLAKQRLDAA